MRTKSVTLTFPTVKDSVREGAELLYVKVVVSDQLKARFRVKVTD